MSILSSRLGTYLVYAAGFITTAAAGPAWSGLPNQVFTAHYYLEAPRAVTTTTTTTTTTTAAAAAAAAATTAARTGVVGCGMDGMLGSHPPSFHVGAQEVILRVASNGRDRCFRLPIGQLLRSAFLLFVGQEDS